MKSPVWIDLVYLDFPVTGMSESSDFPKYGPSSKFQEGIIFFGVIKIILK